MKKLAVIILAVLGVAFGTTMSASAVDGYPPGTQVSVTGPTPQNPVAPGGTYTVNVNNLPPNTQVTLTVGGTTKTLNSGPTGGTLAFNGLTAPTTPGSYTVTALVGTNTTPVVGSIVVATAAVTTTTVAATTTTLKPTNTVPATGSNTPFTGLAIGIPLLVGGLVLLVVSRRRRPVGA